MTKTVGTYYFGRHRSQWGIWIVICNANGIMMGEHVKDVRTYEDAVKETYRMNGWGEPKNVVRKY